MAQYLLQPIRSPPTPQGSGFGANHSQDAFLPQVFELCATRLRQPNIQLVNWGEQTSTLRLKIDVGDEECCIVVKGGRSLLDQLSTTQTRTACTPRHRERLRNTVYRGTCRNANQRTRIQRFLDRTTGNEEYVLVPDGNIVSLATQQFCQIYLLLLKPILSAT